MRQLRICGLAGWAILVLGTTVLAQGSQTTSPVRLTLTLERPRSVLHEPIYAAFSVLNGLNDEIRFDLGLNHESTFSFSITAPSGRTIAVAKRLGSDDLGTNPGFVVGSIGVVSVPSGQRYTQRVLLSQWYEFASLGTYNISIQPDTVFRTSSGRTITPLVASPVRLSVGERDAAYLQRLATDFAEIAVSSSTVQIQKDAAIGLSYLRDPVAIPLLAQVLDRGTLVREYALVGLCRIGDAEAVEVLVRSLQTTTDSRVQALVKVALKTVEAGNSDERVKTRIRTVLSR